MQMPRAMVGWLGLPNMRTMNVHVFFILRFAVVAFVDKMLPIRQLL